MLQMVQLGMSTPPIITRAQAKAAGLKRYFSGEPCVNGHVAERNVSDKHCMACNRARDAARRPERRDDMIAYLRAYYKPVYGPPMPKGSRMLKDAAIAAGKATYFDGIACPHGHVAERKVSNSTCCECHRLKSLERMNKPGVREKIMQATAERLTRVARATPGWVDWDAVTRMYAEAAYQTWLTGVEHHVDHIVPIRGKNVCGLHVHTNMRVIPGDVNRRKSNKLLEED